MQIEENNLKMINKLFTFAKQNGEEANEQNSAFVIILYRTQNVCFLYVSVALCRIETSKGNAMLLFEH